MRQLQTIFCSKHEKSQNNEQMDKVVFLKRPRQKKR